MFSESWWIGTKEENPEEARLDFPKELSQVRYICIFSFSAFASLRETLFGWFQVEKTEEFDFRGGAGAAAASVKTTPETGSQQPTETETDSPEVVMEEILSDDDGEFMDDKIQVTPVQVTPVRHSQRNSGKKFK